MPAYQPKVSLTIQGVSFYIRLDNIPSIHTEPLTSPVTAIYGVAEMPDSSEIDPNWHYFSVSADSLIKVCSRCLSKPYLSLRLPARDSERRALRVDVRRIIFTTVSLDQSWSDYPQHHGTYDHSYSSFYAHIYATDCGCRESKYVQI